MNKLLKQILVWTPRVAGILFIPGVEESAFRTDADQNAVHLTSLGATAGIVLATSSPDPDPVPGGTTGRVLQGISGAGVSW